MTEAFVERGKIDIARVLSGTFGVVGRNIAAFAVLGLVLAGIPLAIVSYLQTGFMRGQFDDIENGTFNFSTEYFASAGLGGLAALICSAVLQGALIYVTVQDMNGNRASIGEALANGLRNFLSLIVVSILFALGLAAGFIFLIVPGVMLACAWCVAVPSLVADRTGIFGAFSRSAELTRGNRWRIFGLGLILWVVLIVVGLVFNAISGVNTLAGDVSGVVDRVTSPLFILLNVVQSVITTVLGSALAAVLYVELRRAREGAGPEWLSEIFS